jgi:hypothetical protein
VRRLALAVVLLSVAAGGCTVFRREPFEVPSGHRAVMGDIAIAGFTPPHVVLEIVRDDGSYQHELPVDAIRGPFLITLPPGRYLINRLRINETGPSFPAEPWFRVGVEFTVGESAVYVGTLQLERIAFARQVRVEIQDEYDRAVPAMRAEHPELPAVVTRAIMKPA